MPPVPYVAGLHRLTPSTYAYLQPPGTWGFSNSGLIVDCAEAVLVDTQFTLALTRQLLDVVARTVPGARISTVVTTHANGDHCWGNQLLPEAVTIGSAATAAGMAEEVQPAVLAELISAAPAGSPLGMYMRRFFGQFDFSGITPTSPASTFTGQTQIAAGTRAVRLVEVGPAHTSGDVIVHVPDEDVLFAGDILFINDHPVVWSGPIDGWVAACDLILASGATTIVPGHGPVTDPAGVRVFRDYLAYLDDQAQRRFQRGMPFWRAALDIVLPTPYSGWGHPERLVMALAAIYRGLGYDGPTDLMTVLTYTAEAYQQLSTSRG